MTISIIDHQLPEETHNRYDVTFYDVQIPTLLTHSPPMVDQWLSELSQSQTHPFLVGLDVEWRPNFSPNSDHPIATVQLCAPGPTCLIFQILHSPHVPQSLIDFLGDPANTFVGVGVGIAEDVEKLLCDYELRVANAVDLRRLAPKEMKKAGLKTMAKEVLGKEMEKPKNIQRSRWDNPWLTAAQVKYACVDAFLSFEIGKSLKSGAGASVQ